MQENKSFTAFQDLRIFENEKINVLCDALTEKVRAETGGELIVGGSIAKIFDGQFSENYNPKDVDFILSRNDYHLFSFYLNSLDGVIMIEKSPCKITLHTEEKIVIEVWKDFFQKKRTKKYYKNLIPYLLI